MVFTLISEMVCGDDDETQRQFMVASLLRYDNQLIVCV